MDRKKLLDKVENVIQNSEHAKGKMYVTKKSREAFLNKKRDGIGDENNICLGSYSDYQALTKELNQKVPEAKFTEDNYNTIFMSVRESLDMSIEEMKAIAEVTCDNGFLYDLRDQGAEKEYEYFKDKRLGFVYEDCGCEYHYCLDDGKLYKYDESANPCMSTEGLDIEHWRSYESESEYPEKYGSVDEAMTNKELSGVFRRKQSIVTYSGYKQDIASVISIINSRTIGEYGTKLVHDNEVIESIAVYVHPEDITPDYNTHPWNEIHVMNKSTFCQNYNGTYDSYLRCAIIASVYFAKYHNANPAIVYEIAKWDSGLYMDYKKEGLSRSAYAYYYNIQKIYDKDGYKGLEDIVEDPTKLFAYSKEMAKDNLKGFFEAAKDMSKLHDDHDWSAEGLRKLARRIKMNNKKGVYKLNDVDKQIKATLDILQPNPDIDFDKDGKVEQDEKAAQVHTANIIPTNDKIASMIPKPSVPAGPGGGGSPKAEAAELDAKYLSFISNGETLMIIGEASKPNYNRMLYKNLYNDRMRKNSEVLSIYKDMKAVNPWIKNTFINTERYKFNLFIDTYFYNQTFFSNNVYSREQTVGLYKELLKRLINDDRFARYKKQTVFFNVLGWTSDTSLTWMYRKSLNPISIIYRLMELDMNSMVEIFGDRDVVFCGPSNYFKVNFSKPHKINVKAKFLYLIRKLFAIGNGVPEADPTDEPSGDSAKAITLDIIEKLDKTQGIKIDSMKGKNIQFTDKGGRTVAANVVKDKAMAVDDREKAEAKAKAFIEPKAVTGAPIPTQDEINKKADEANKSDLVDCIIQASSNSSSVDDAIEKMESDRIQKLIADVAASEEETSINNARATRLNSVRDQFMDKELNGVKVRDMLTVNSKAVNVKDQIPKSELPVASINDEWKELTYVNFDKQFNVDAAIVNILNSMADWSYPIVVRNLDRKDTSTSEDYIITWTVECEDSFGKRFTLKFDVPKFVQQNRYMMLRGNRKTIETQLFLMPILKTDDDAAQIVSNYNKIFIRRYGSTPGKSCVYADMIVKYAKKYQGNKIKFTFGDNTKICGKYDLPIDYIDIAQVISKIELPDRIYYFDQDELRSKYPEEIAKITRGLPIGISKSDKRVITVESTGNSFRCSEFIVGTLANVDSEFADYSNKFSKSSKYCYSRASILNSNIPVVVLCGYAEGLTSTLNRMGVNYKFSEKLDKVDRWSTIRDYIKFEDGYLTYDNTPAASLMMNGLKECDTENYPLTDIDSKAMYVDFLDNFCERIKTDGLDNFKDCMIDPITKECLEYYGLPTDYVGCLVYASGLLSDNAYIRHTDMQGRRIRRAELVAGYVYKAITNAYGQYSQQVKHSRRSVPMTMRQSAVIDLILLDPTEKDYSTSSMLNDVESVNAISTKGLSGMNSERSYDLDKRTYDKSMLNVLGMSTGFAGNAGITRQATLNMSVEGERGYIVGINNDSTKLNDVNTLTATEAMTPMGTTHDDPFRTAMTFVQKSKHTMRCVDGDPLLVTNGADEALPLISSDIFAFKSKGKGKVVEMVPGNYMIVQYTDNSIEDEYDYVDLSYTVQKNSDGGFYVPLQLVTELKEGSAIKKGQILAYDPLSIGNTMGETDTMAYKAGTLAKVAILTTDEGFEDSAIMSHRLSKAMACDVIKVREVTLSKDTSVYNILSPGTHIEEGDIMMQYQTPYESEDLQILQRNLAGDEESLSQLGRRPIKAECTGTLTDVRVYRTCEIDELSPSLKKLVNAYEKPIKEKKKALEAKGIPTNTLPPTYKLPATGKLKHCEDGVFIEFCQEYRDDPAVGDKIVWYSANKGVNKGLFPEGEEPYTDLRPNEVIDGFITNTSINGRMVTSIIAVGALNKLMIELDRTCKEMLGIPFDDSIA